MRYNYPVVQIIKPDLLFNRACLEFVPLMLYRVVVSGDLVFILPDKFGNKIHYDGRRSAELYVGAALHKIGERDKTHHKLYRYKDGFSIRLSEVIKEE